MEENRRGINLLARTELLEKIKRKLNKVATASPHNLFMGSFLMFDDGTEIKFTSATNLTNIPKTNDNISITMSVFDKESSLCGIYNGVFSIDHLDIFDDWVCRKIEVGYELPLLMCHCSYSPYLSDLFYPIEEYNRLGDYSIASFLDIGEGTRIVMVDTLDKSGKVRSFFSISRKIDETYECDGRTYEIGNTKSKQKLIDEELLKWKK